MAKKKAILILHLDAGHDTNGNPRRVFVVFDKNGDIINAFDEGYYGDANVRRAYPGVPFGPRFSTSYADYKQLMKTFDEPRD